MDIAHLLTTENLIALLTLSTLEIVLGIDNIVFIAILTSRLPPKDQPRARRVGLGLAMISRIMLLFALSWVIRLVDPLFSIAGKSFSGKDLILLGGGLFLLAKATFEIHGTIDGHGEKDSDGDGRSDGKASYAGILIQIAILDIVFSLDSVITAVGMAREVSVMIAAVLISVSVMLVFANSISEFILRHPTVKMLALSFLMLIGLVLLADGMGQHIEKGYIYFAMGFSIVVEMLNLKLRKKTPKA